MSRGKKKVEQDDAPGGLTHNPFASLRGDGTPAPRVQPVREPVHEPGPTPADGPKGRLVVRREKKGRGGKTVTRVSGLGLDADALTELAREMKRALGCGASVDADDVLLQGALTERAAAWLEQRLDRRVSIGN